jgi:manganese-dependent inorganic pyrophosphatase
MPAPTYIIGHKNPDADSICAALAYADFKHLTGDNACIAARCGNSNARIDAILQRFETDLPVFLGDVTPRVRDIMVSEVIHTHPLATCAEALELIDEHDIRILPVVDEEERLEGYISIFQLGEFFIPKLKELKELRRVHTSIEAIVRSLKAKVLHRCGDDGVEDLFVRVGAMDIRSFGRFSETEAVPPEKSIIVVGDRWDIQQKSIQIGVKLLVITGGLAVEQEVVDLARQRGVNLIVSSFDSATTAWLIRTASTINRLIEKNCHRFSPDVRLAELRRKVVALNAPAFMVVDDERHLLGIFTKTDLLKPVPLSLILVDHNELSQAVPGAAEVNIREIVDHHRLGNLHTQQPILFINEPVGSTCTIVADLYRREDLTPSPRMAGIMMSGIISDTLNLNSPTTTEKDRVILHWLAKIAEVEPGDLATLIFSSGSVILDNPPETVVRSDFKVYDEFGIRFSVSQVEELGFSNFWDNSDALLQALQDIQTREKLFFSSLLVTDINSQNSLLVVAGDQEFIDRIPYVAVQKDEIFDMPGMVSRKKQVIPFITGVLRSLEIGAVR